MASLVAEGLELMAAADAAALDGHFAVRHAVFVADQGLFEGTDRDAHDDDPATVHVVATVGGAIVGAVRLYPLAGSTWKGDRLAVLPEARVGTVGAELVRFAVRTANGAGTGCSPTCSCPTCASSSGWAGRAMASRSATWASCTSRWRSG